MIDLEACPFGLGGQRLLVEVSAGGARRPLPQPRLELLDFLPLAGDLDLDRAVPQVAHPAHQPQLAGDAARGVAEADALDAPAQPQPQGHPLALPASGTAAARIATARTAAARAAAAHLPPSFQPWRPTSGTKPTSSPSLRRSSPRADLR